MARTTETHPRDADRLIYAGLLGLSAATVVQLIDKSDLELAQSIVAYAFALAIPLLAVGLITDYARRAGTHIPLFYDRVGLAGVIAAVVGLGAIFFHLGVGAGVVFAAGCVVGIFLVRAL